jgi:hypothetical protein
LLPYKPRNSPDKILLCLFIRFIAYMFKDFFIDICLSFLLWPYNCLSFCD